MLYIRYKNGRECTWHVDESKPADWVVSDKDHGIFEISADFHELEYIRARFRNLPDVYDTRMVTWAGDFAQFIHDNL